MIADSEMSTRSQHCHYIAMGYLIIHGFFLFRVMSSVLGDLNMTVRSGALASAVSFSYIFHCKQESIFPLKGLTLKM